MITRLNKPIHVEAQDTSADQNKSLRDAFSSNFEFTDNTSSEEMLLAESSDCDCCCDCNCDYCDCQCQCVSHCNAGTHAKDKYHFYNFKSNPDDLKVIKPVLDGNYANDFYLNSRMTESGSASQYTGIQYTVYTPIFNYFTADTSAEHKTNGTYHHITNPLEFTGNFDSGTTATYDNVDNTLVFYTSKYTQKVQVKIQGDIANNIITLERNLDSNTGAQLNTNLNITGNDEKVLVNVSGSSANESSDIVTWTFKFKVATYGLFSQPLPNTDTQQGTISIVDAWDFNFNLNNPSSSYKNKNVPAGLPTSIVEKEPDPINFDVRQPKLNNFKILEVLDIYWKNAVPTVGFGVEKMPYKTNAQANNRHISLGYMVGFLIKSTDFSGSKFEKIIITPSYTCNGQPVELYYDEPNNRKYNIPLSNLVSWQTQYTPVIVLRNNPEEKIPGTDTIKKKTAMSTTVVGKEELTSWRFSYYLPANVKAYAPSVNPALYTTPAQIAKLKTLQKKGLIQIKFNIEGVLEGPTKISGNNTYDFTNKAKNPVDTAGGLGGGGVFYYNMDWTALNDYSTQQR